MKNPCFLSIFLLLFSVSVWAQKPWTKEKANAWYERQPWLVGCNFIPSTAINQLEMWQAETFDKETIDRELSWAADLGFNIVRVYLHYLPWQADSAAFKARIESYLQIADKHGIKTMFVLYDDCWYGNPQPGKQPNPVPGLHNSGWVQCPRYAEVMDESMYPVFEHYTKGIIGSFANDKRVIVWDLYNEAGNNHLPEDVLPLLKKVFLWARQAKPTQPLTSSIWRYKNQGFKTLNDFLLNNSDVITFHNYGKYENLSKDIANFKSFGRPLICTEYLARGNKSLFETCMPLMKSEQVGAINWGLVFGKTQTVFPWDAPLNGDVPELWHHDIFYPNGKAFSEAEVRLIKKLTP